MPGNVRNPICGAGPAVRETHLPRDPAAFRYRFNRRFQREDLLSRFVHVALRTPPLPNRPSKDGKGPWDSGTVEQVKVVPRDKEHERSARITDPMFSVHPATRLGKRIRGHSGKDKRNAASQPKGKTEQGAERRRHMAESQTDDKDERDEGGPAL